MYSRERRSRVLGLSLTLTLGLWSWLSCANAASPVGYEADLMKATQLATEGRFRQAIEILNQLTARFPESRVAHALKADLLIGLTGQLPLTQTSAAPSAREILDPIHDELRLRWMHLTKTQDQSSPSLPASILKPSMKNPFTIYVDLPAARLYVFDTRHPTPSALASYYVTIGRKGFGKRKEGDLKTPVGVYRLTGYKPGSTLHERYGFGALTTDYPNALDRQLKRTGYGIWIHGTEPGWENRGPRASDGCITLSNTDFKTLVTTYPMGTNTSVIIDDAPQWVSINALDEFRDEMESALNLAGKDRAAQAHPDMPGVPHFAHSEPLATFQEVYMYPGSGADLMTRRLLPETGDHAVEIDEYWTRNAAGAWERVSF